MRKLMKKLEDIMVAVTFAEAGEYDEACKHSGDDVPHGQEDTPQGYKKTALENAGK